MLVRITSAAVDDASQSVIQMARIITVVVELDILAGSVIKVNSACDFDNVLLFVTDKKYHRNLPFFPNNFIFSL